MKDKIIEKKYLYLGISLILLVIMLFYINLLKTQEIFYKVEIYQKVKLSDIIVDHNLSEDKEIQATELGNQEITYQYLEQGKKKNAKIKIKAIDKTPPLVWLGSTYTVQQGSKIDLEESILCIDNYDRTPNCHIIGDYDLNKVGEYPLTYVALDASQNETRVDFTLRVIEKSINEGNTSTNTKRVTLEEVKNKYLTNDAILGIDVSKWQGEINWQEVKSSGVEFVMIRMGTQQSPGKDSVVDPYFEANITGAKKVGLKVGVYYFSYAASVQEAKEQAEWVTKKLAPYELDLPIVFDWECYGNLKEYKLNLYELNELANQFLEQINSSGYQSMFYASKNYLEKLWIYIEHDIWLAHYTEKTNYEGDYLLWQFTNVGKIPGIAGNVDIDLMLP